MANEDQTKWEYILNLPLFEFLFRLTFVQQQSVERQKELMEIKSKR